MDRAGLHSLISLETPRYYIIDGTDTVSTHSIIITPSYSH